MQLKDQHADCVCFCEPNFSSVSDAERGDDPSQVSDEQRGQIETIFSFVFGL